jgi:integrase/recombinase XerC
LAKLTPQDVRAFMAARRADGISGRSLMRGLAGMRSFARFLERNNKGKVGALAAVRAPKVPKTLPKPLHIDAARKVVDADTGWRSARKPWCFTVTPRSSRYYTARACVFEALGPARRRPPSGQATPSP